MRRIHGPIRFEKVQHDGCHQDYRLYADDRHVGNVRAGFSDSRGRTRDWHARSDVDGIEIVLSSEKVKREDLAWALIRFLNGYGDGYSAEPKIMQTTKDVGADE